jgi:uncharacterized membrane protein YdbT with pleckstrin-like domain
MFVQQDSIRIMKTWRSEVVTLCVFVIMSVLAVTLSNIFPWSIIEGELFKIGETSYRMTLPLFWFMPLITIGSAIFRIYNVRYTITARGIEYEKGIIELRIKLIRVWFEDIRTVQKNQTILERLLDIGSIQIGTAATGTLEITLRGLAAPDEVLEMIQRERDNRQKIAQKTSNIPQH